jgi:hypothetical protein
MARGEVWRCTNAECGCEIHVILGARDDGPGNPTCACGAALKKPYLKPAIKKAGVQECGRLKKIDALEMA